VNQYIHVVRITLVTGAVLQISALHPTAGRFNPAVGLVAEGALYAGAIRQNVREPIGDAGSSRRVRGSDVA
jgi:hypothetical protein